jgi:hypothetical protein
MDVKEQLTDESVPKTVPKAPWSEPHASNSHGFKQSRFELISKFF